MNHRSDHRTRVATALAGAFLAGEWIPEAMGRRAKRAVGDRRGWLVDLAKVARSAYPERPADRPRELARFIAACELFDTAFGGDRPPQVRVWMAAPTEMGPLRCRVPVISDTAALAGWLGVTERHLDWFADRRSLERTTKDERLRHYRRRWVRKADGSGRLLEAPKRELKDLQRQVLHHIVDHVPGARTAYGFRRGWSALATAEQHCGQAVVIRFDLEAFFTSVAAGRVFGIFRWAGYPEPVAHALAALCTTTTPRHVLRGAPAIDPRHGERARRLTQRLARPHLPQGSPTSPALANLCAYRLDQRLFRLAQRFDARYTRYADDLIFSGDADLIRGRARFSRLVETIVTDEGFRLHDAKTTVRTAAQRQTVTGLVVNQRPNAIRADYDRLRAVLHDAARSGPEAANRYGHADFRAHLRGRISWVAAGNPARIGKLERAFAAIDWS